VISALVSQDFGLVSSPEVLASVGVDHRGKPDRSITVYSIGVVNL